MDSLVATQSLADNPFVVVAIAMVIVVGLLLISIRRDWALLIYVTSLLFISMPLLGGRVLWIPGLSIANLVLLLGVALTVQSMREPGRLEPVLRLRMILYVAIISWSTFYALFHLDAIRRIMETRELTEFEFLRTFFVRPLIIWVIFLLAAKHAARSPDGALRMTRILAVAVIAFGMVMLGATAYYYTRSHDLNVVREDVGDFLGLHSNDYVLTFVLSAPLFFSFFIRRTRTQRLAALDRMLFLGAIGVVLAGTLFAYSRSAYLALGAIVMIYLVYGGRRGVLLLIPIILVVAILLPQSVTERMEFGFTRDTKGHLEMTDVTAGRASMTSAVIDKLSEDNLLLLIGDGRFTFVPLLYKKFGVNHPHNGYLEIVLDTGLIGLAVVLALFAKFLMLFRRGWKYGLRQNRNLYFAGMICVASFMVLAASGRTFYPSASNVSFWLIAGIVLGTYQRERALKRVGHAKKASEPVSSGQSHEGTPITSTGTRKTGSGTRQPLASTIRGTHRIL